MDYPIRYFVGLLRLVDKTGIETTVKMPSCPLIHRPDRRSALVMLCGAKITRQTRLSTLYPGKLTGIRYAATQFQDDGIEGPHHFDHPFRFPPLVAFSPQYDMLIIRAQADRELFRFFDTDFFSVTLAQFIN